MSRHQATYKRNICRYEEKRTIRAAIKEKDRRESRHKDYASRRNIDEDVLQPLTDNVYIKKDKKALQLLKWKQQKEKERLAEIKKKAKDKPPFKCGTVHHKLVAEFPSPVNTSKLNRSKAFNASKVERSFAPKLHQFKPPKSVVPVQVVQLRSNQKTKEVGEKEFSQNSFENNKSKTGNRAKKGFPETGLPNKISRAVSRYTEIQPRRSVRLSDKSFRASERKTLGNKDTSHLPTTVENLSPVVEEKCENEDTQNNFIIPANLSPWLFTRRRSARVSDLKTLEPVKGNLSVQEDKQEDKDKNKISPPSMLYPASLSPNICKIRGRERYHSPAKSLVQTRESGGLRKQIAMRLIEEKVYNPLEIEKEEEKCMSTTEDFFDISHKEDQNIKHFRNLHSNEMKRLGSICLDWDALLPSLEIPTEIQDSIRSTVGQARLFMREKLAQFKGLIDKCASCGPSTDCKVTHSDLQGFWDLVSIQVNDIDNKFNSLSELKQNNWIEVVKDEPQKRKSRLRNVDKPPLKTKKPSKENKSAFQLFLKEQKKKKQEEKRANQSVLEVSTPSQLNTSIRSILRRSRSVKSTKKSPEGHNEGGPPAIDMTPRRVTFKEGAGEEGTPKKKKPVTPHIRKGMRSSSNLSNSFLLDGSPVTPCTPMPDGNLISFGSPFEDQNMHRCSPRIRAKSAI